MSTDLVEVAKVLPHAPEQVWQVLGDPELYPRFVREVAWSERVGHNTNGSGARYRMRFTVDGAQAVTDEVEVLVHRPAEHLVLVSPSWQGGHLSVRLERTHRGATEVQVMVAISDRLAPRAGITAARR